MSHFYNMPLHVNLHPIYYLCLEDTNWLPGKRPYFHQKRIYDLILEVKQKKEFICIFNTAVTGGGKTLASYAASILHDIPAFGLYPTNELIEDQERALKPEFSNSDKYPLLRIDSRQLDEWEATLDRKSHQDTLRTLLSWRKVILTNPDIFYMLYFGIYQGFPGIAEYLFNLTASYPVIVFDEFHLYNIKQLGNVAFMVASLRELQKSQEKIFIFSSATPNPRFLDVLNKLEIQTELVETQRAEESTDNTACVSQPLSLAIIPGDLSAWKGLETLEENFNLIEKFMNDFPEAKAVFILDSIAETLELTHQLKEKYPDFSVGEVHGLASKQSREKALKSKFTVGTSTIEVGIDFKGGYEKDLLVFEARTGSQFIQRLGRIARHAKNTDIPNRAIAIVPPYVYNDLIDKLESNAALEREMLYECIEDAYQKPNEFEGYFKKYSPVEAFSGAKFIEHQQLPDTYPVVKAKLDKTIELIYDKPIKKTASFYSYLYHENITAPLFFFRGSGFDIALIDKDAEGFPLKTYDLFFVLRRTVFRELSYEEFQEYMTSFRNRYEEDVKVFEKRAKQVTSNVQDLLGVYGYFEITGLLDKARKAWFEINRDELEMTNFNTEDVSKIKRLKICTDPPTNLQRVNKLLRRKEFVCWVSERNASTLRRRKSLPALFQLYDLKPIGRTGIRGKTSWTIAFNQNAYFMNCLWFKKNESSKSYIV